MVGTGTKGSVRCEVTCVAGVWKYAPGPVAYEVGSLPTCHAANAVVTGATDSDCTTGNAPMGDGSSTCDLACVGGEWQFQPRITGGVANRGNFCIYYTLAWPCWLFSPVLCYRCYPLAHQKELVVRPLSTEGRDR